jgi:hypothetical protein
MSVTNEFDEDLDGLIWGAAPIGETINRSPKATYWLLENGHIDADKIGGRWCTTRRRARKLRVKKDVAA